MCGIFLCIDKNINISKCIKCLNILKNRGPDYIHYNIHNNNIFLGQTVLSIVGEYDKTNFFNNNYEILFNGEIYNYKKLEKNNSSDTSVLVNLFENNSFNDVINLLDGMYCFICMNKKENLLYISRDLQGEKGLYYYKDDNKIIFSSEIKPILTYLNKNDLNINELQNYFFTRHLITTENTIYNNIKIVKAGENMIINLNNMEIKKFHKDIGYLVTRNKINEYNNKSNEELKIILKNLLIKNINEMIPTCNFALVVSGGIDSTLISKLINKNILYINCNCIGKDLINIEEFKKHFNINQINIDSKNYINNLIKSQSIFMHPIPTHSAVTYSIMCEYLNKNNIKVLFTGEGADELFGGYECYNNNKIDTNISPSNYSKFIDNQIGKYDSINLKKMLSDKYCSYCDLYKSMDDKNYYYQAQFLTDFYFMANGVGNRCSDLIGGLHGIEMRSVFYRKEILEFIVNCPLRVKIDFKETKIILKDIFRDYFGNDLIYSKQGYCGFPNDCKILIKNFNLTEKYLKFKLKEEYDNALEWKFINTEVFLKYIYLPSF